MVNEISSEFWRELLLHNTLMHYSNVVSWVVHVSPYTIHAIFRHDFSEICIQQTDPQLLTVVLESQTHSEHVYRLLFLLLCFSGRAFQRP